MESRNRKSSSTSSTERRHYLAGDSIAPSESASMINFNQYSNDDNDAEADGTATPRANARTTTRSPTASDIHAALHQHQRRQTIPGSNTVNNNEDDDETSSIASSAITISHRLQPYRGFPSEEAYLLALRQWGESRRYVELDTPALIGFYGQKTVEDIASQPRPEMSLGLRKKWRARRERKASVAGGGTGVGAGERGQEQRSDVGGRRNTVA